MDKQEVIICRELEADLSKIIARCPHDKLFVLADKHTSEICFPLIAGFGCLEKANVICIGADDSNKNLVTLSQVWKELGMKGASRQSLLINLGGGMVTDLGGFAASTFKRGIRCINIPTTLLAMVDASVGGKTGINFNGLKNEIGAFFPAECVLIDTRFLKSLDDSNLLSGYAEMLKHGLISNNAHWTELLNFDWKHIDYDALQTLVARSVQIKERIVEQDPFEKGIRKALNLGHTVGHAFESLALEIQHPVLHGYAVAWGIVCELYFSCVKTGFPKDKLRQTIQFIKEHYGIWRFDCKQYNHLYEFMTHDKKNVAGRIHFTLLAEVGDIRINQSASQAEIFEMLDFYRETMGC